MNVSFSMKLIPCVPSQFHTLSHPVHFLRSHPHRTRHTSTFHCTFKENIPRGRALYKRPYSNMASTKPIVAVLYQALPPPMYDGVSKPPKPGGKNSQKIQTSYSMNQFLTSRFRIPRLRRRRGIYIIPLGNHSPHTNTNTRPSQPGRLVFPRYRGRHSNGIKKWGYAPLG